MRTSDFLTIAAAIVPDRPAVIFDGEAVTFEDLQARVNRLANAMAERGVRAGDRVAIMQVNGLLGIELYFAAAQLDAIYVPINFPGQDRRAGADGPNCPAVFAFPG